jgi:predicted nucleotidyltransferase
MFLENYIEQIKKLCENHKVKQLYAFGSVLDKRFSDNSDIDLIVDFQSSDPIEYAENYFALKFSLQGLLERQIDLLEHRAIRNKYLLQSINESKRLIYEA